MIIRPTVVLTLLYMSANATPDHVEIKHTSREIAIQAFDDPQWAAAKEVAIHTYWSGQKAPNERGFRARLLWSSTSLYVRFEAEQREPLIISEKPDVSSKALGLWNRDVCEIFIAPDKNKPGKYYEFEVAPNGEWVDLGIDLTTEKRQTDVKFASGMTSSARIDDKSVMMVIKIPFAPIAAPPKAGDVWLGNLFRCVGKNPTRGYLAWRPTRTSKPNFHVPAVFGELMFVE